MFSHLTHLECTACGKWQNAEQLVRTCTICGKVLFARYDVEAVRTTLDRSTLQQRPPGMWRYHELMPVREPKHVVSLGEGSTPIISAPRLARHIGLNSLMVKDEGGNPTGSFKARGLSAAVSRAVELGITKLTMPSAGNAAGALAAYCAHAGIEAHVFMPKDAPIANQLECRAYGARLTLVDGFITDAGKASAAAASQQGLFDVSTLREPYRAEGKKTMGYEIAEQLDWQLPDVIVYPTGGGTGIVGIWKAFEEMEALRWIQPGGTRPRMVSVQAEGCAPIVTAFRQGRAHAEPIANPYTIAAGMRVPAAIGDYLVLRAVRESGGTCIAVSDAEMLAAVREMALYAGIFVAPEGAATLAALRRLIDDGSVRRDERVLLLNTGSATKYLDVLAPGFSN